MRLSFNGCIIIYIKQTKKKTHEYVNNSEQFVSLKSKYKYR